MAGKAQPLLRASEVAERLNIPERTVLRYAQQGILPSVRLAGIVRFKAEAIEKAIEEATLLGVASSSCP